MKTKTSPTKPAARFKLTCHDLPAKAAKPRAAIPAHARTVFQSSVGSGDLTIYQDRQRRFLVRKTHGVVDGQLLPEGQSVGETHPELRGLDDAAAAARRARCRAVEAVWPVSRRQAAQIAILESLPLELAKVYV